MSGPGAQSETVQIEYKRNERLVKHPAASVVNLSRPIPVMPDFLEWSSSSTRSPSPPPRTRPVERSAERSAAHSTPPGVQKQTEISSFFAAQKETEHANFFGPSAGKGTHPLAQRAGFFFSGGTGLLMAVRKNHPWGHMPECHPPPALIVYDMQPADSPQPSVFTPLSFSAHSHCASCTLGGLRARQSPTA